MPQVTNYLLHQRLDMVQHQPAGGLEPLPLPAPFASEALEKPQ